MGVGESRYFRGHVDGPESSEVNISSSNDNVAKFRASSSFSYGFEGYIDAVGAGNATITVSFAGNKNYKAAESKTLTVTVLAPASSGPEVAWNKAEKTGKFTMPGGNVTLEPEYYPQAALTAAPTAINDVPATTDGAIVKAGTVANIGSTETAQGTVMYYVSPTALDDAALLALAADKWTADVPTAEKLTKGEAYVYYYVRGNDSDTDDERHRSQRVDRQPRRQREEGHRSHRHLHRREESHRREGGEEGEGPGWPHHRNVEQR